MKYYLFIDESGDHGLVKLDVNFPVFVLCGALMNEDSYFKLRDEINDIKKTFWGDKDVIFHSRDIRKCQKEFQIFFDLELKAQFYKELNSCMSSNDYHIISSAIQKSKYIKTYGKLSNDVYELSLSFIIERAVFCLDELKKDDEDVCLYVVIEKRGKKEDSALAEHFQRLLARGTAFVDKERLSSLSPKIIFRDKKQNVNGLQLADLLAYPTARYVIDKNRANPAFDLFEDKFYKRRGKRFGLKIFP
jgi:hypothetical protein